MGDPADDVLAALRETANGGPKTGRLIAARAVEEIERLRRELTDPRPAFYEALTTIVGDIGAIDDKSSRRAAAHMLHCLLRPTDEPTEADPDLDDLFTVAHAFYIGDGDEHGIDAQELVGMLVDELRRTQASRAGLKEAVTDLNAELATAEDELIRLRALVGGRSAAPPDLGPFDPETFERFATTADPSALAELIQQATGSQVESVSVRSAAPTRDEDDERSEDRERRMTLAAERLVSAIDAHVVKGNEPLAAGSDPATAAALYSEDSVDLLRKARECLAALLSRPAAEPNEGHGDGR